MGTRRNLRPFLLFFLIAGLFLHPEASSQQVVPSVRVIKVTRDQKPVFKDYIGHTEPIEEVGLIAKVQGYLKEIRFQEGSMVKAGDLLFVIEQEPFRAEVSIAEARLEQAQAELFRATQYLKRLREVKSGAVSQLELDKAIADELKAKADIKLREAELQNARLNLGYTEIRSPITGKIGKAYFKKGDLVGPGSGALATVVSLDPLRVVFSVPERESPKAVRLINKKATLLVEVPTVDAQQGKIPATIEFLDNKVDPKTGTVAVYARLANPHKVVLPGQYVKVLLQEEDNITKFTVPQRSVLQDQKGRYVFVVKDGVVMEKRVLLGEMLGDGWEVMEGLNEGDLIVVDGIQKVRPNMKVTVEGAEHNQGKR